MKTVQKCDRETTVKNYSPPESVSIFCQQPFGVQLLVVPGYCLISTFYQPPGYKFIFFLLLLTCMCKAIEQTLKVFEIRTGMDCIDPDAKPSYNTFRGLLQ